MMGTVMDCECISWGYWVNTVTGDCAPYKIAVNMLALAAHRASCGECARTGDGGVVMTGSDPAILGRLPNRWSALFTSA